DRLRINDLVGGLGPAFMPLEQDVLNLGHTDSSVWLHLQLQADATLQDKLVWLLQLRFPLLERVDIFVVNAGLISARHLIGYAGPMKERVVQHRYFIQPVKLQPGQTTDLYINIMRTGGNVQAPLSLATPAAFFRAETSTNHAMGIYFGIMIAMIVYNFFLLFSVGNRAYFYYVVYIGITVVTIQTLSGYGYLFLWPEHPWVNQYVTQIAAVLAVISGI